MTREIHRRSRATRRDSGSGWRISLLALGAFACGGDAGNGRNLLFLVVDTLRADHLGVYGYERPVSPEIDAWAARGAILDRAYATSPWTLPSFGSLFTGQIPSRHAAGLVAPGPQGQRAFVQLDGSVPTLAEILGEHGYETVAILTNPFLHPSFQLGRGFETYDYVPGDNATIRRANVIVDRTLRFFDQREGRPGKLHGLRIERCREDLALCGGEHQISRRRHKRPHPWPDLQAFPRRQPHGLDPLVP